MSISSIPCLIKFVRLAGIQILLYIRFNFHLPARFVSEKVPCRHFWITFPLGLEAMKQYFSRTGNRKDHIVFSIFDSALINFMKSTYVSRHNYIVQIQKSLFLQDFCTICPIWEEYNLFNMPSLRETQKISMYYIILTILFCYQIKQLYSNLCCWNGY